MTDISHLEISENAVIIIRDDLNDGDEYGHIEDLGVELNARFPSSFVIWLDTSVTFETMPEEQLRTLLEELIAHQEARG